MPDSRLKSLKGLFGKPRASEPGERSADPVGLGDAARDRRDWLAAAAHYREAVAADPALRHIWIQLGHAEKERGELDAAQDAYLAAEALSADDGEPALHLGHVAKLRGDLEEAHRQYLRSKALNPDHPDAALELQRMPAPASSPDDAPLRRAQARRQRAGAVARTKSGVGTALVFDASDLFAYFRNARLPTGIQRVQIEVISSAARSDRDVRVCCFSDTASEWHGVPLDLFLEIAALAVTSGDGDDPAWVDLIEELAATLSFSDPLEFPRGATLVNLGTSWWLQNYFLFVRHARERFGIRYVPFVHDMIPIMTPEHCIRELTQDFISWTQGVFQHADSFLVNSHSTKADLLRVAETLGQAVDPALVSVIRLDADFRRPDVAELAVAALAEWELEPGSYVLFVSTIESRKNHLLAFDAWSDLIGRHGAERVPKLVCVGNDGWLNDAVFARLEADTVLAERVVMLSKLSDAELALLYRECRFTLYTSSYEGWGLPVTESLCYAKVPLISDASSLPEAGGAFADYFTSGSLASLRQPLERLLFDDTYRAAREAEIVAGFKPRHWSEVAAQIGDELDRLARTAGVPRAVVQAATLGAFHPIQRNFATRIWRGFVSGELFRAGTGWWWPDDWGCWTKAGGGQLRIGVPNDAGPLRLYLRLHAPPEAECPFEVKIGSASLRGTLHNSEARWVVLDVPATDAEMLEVEISGAVAVDLAPRTGGVDARIVSVGVAGFFLCAQGDSATRQAITEAVVFNDQASLAFNREPAA